MAMRRCICYAAEPQFFLTKRAMIEINAPIQVPHCRPVQPVGFGFWGIFDYDVKRERLEEVGRELENPNVWDNPERAQQLGKERANLDKIVNGIRTLNDGLSGAGELA